MLDNPTVVINPTPKGTQVLLRWCRQEELKALLPPSSCAHRLAAPMLLEALAHWYQRPLSVALCVDGPDATPDLGLCNALGGGAHTLHYEVELVERGRREQRLHGVAGDFSLVRQVQPRRSL